MKTVSLSSLYLAGLITRISDVQLSKENEYPIIYVTSADGKTTPVMFSKNFATKFEENHGNPIPKGAKIIELFGGNLRSAMVTLTDNGLRIGDGSSGTSSDELAAALGVAVVATTAATADSTESLVAVTEALSAAFAESAARAAVSTGDR